MRITASVFSGRHSWKSSDPAADACDPGTSGTGRSDGGYQHRRMHGFSDAPGKDQK